MVMSPILSIIVWSLALSFLILVHEAGHLIAAKCAGIAVPVFSLGFGKRLAGFKIGETDYRLSLFPLGGYCSIGPDKNADGTESTGSLYGRVSWWRMTTVLLSGVVVNLVLSWLALVVAKLSLGSGLLESLFGAFAALGRLTSFTLTAIPSAFMNTFGYSNSGNVLVGPVGIMSMAPSMTTSVAVFFVLIAQFSLGLAILNLLPIPIMDGGKWLLTSFEYARRKALSNRVIYAVQGSAMALMFVLIIFITFNDIARMF